MAWNHATQYRHYIQMYPSADKEHPEIDLEEYFKCRYVSLKNAVSPSVKSVYTEDYAEQDGKKVYAAPNVVRNSSELTLTLRWRSDECGDVQRWSQTFTVFISGKKFQYHDTFRPNKYWQFIFTDTPTIEAERLHGDLQYMYLSFKLLNFGGVPYRESQL